MGLENLKVVQYLVDTRKLWPSAAKTAQLENEASRALSVLPPEERAKVLKFYFVADAKMSLVSHLLKHWAVARYAGVPWASTAMARDARTKPVYVDPGSGRQPVSFNVSHQAGLVALIVAYDYGTYDTKGEEGVEGEGQGEAGGGGPPVDAGIDVVCTSERRDRDHRLIRAESWASFVDMHAEVFGRREAEYLKSGDLLSLSTQQQQSSGSGSGSSSSLPPLARDDQIVDFKLRLFYTLWCLREAYVKMTGEALLAPWLGDLNFMRFRAPAPGKKAEEGVVAPAAEEDEAITTHEILFHETQVTDANVCIRSLGPDYMVCTAVRTPLRKEVALGLDLRPYEYLSIEDILGLAEA